MSDEQIGSEPGASTPIGTVPAASSTPATPSEPTVLDLSDDALVRVKGSDKPVKFSDYTRGFQAQATKANQERARIERELAARDERLRQLEQERQRYQQQQSQGPQADPYADLKQLPYLSGEDAAKVVQSLSQQFGQRDQIILGLAKELQKLQQSVGGLNQTHAQRTFESKIDRFLSDGGYGPELKDLATETYLAYEQSPDLDAEFPRILAERVEQLTKWISAQQRQKVEAARKPAFIPGRGGQAGPSKPLEVKPDSNARDLADQLFGMFAEGPAT
jgi:hypothetical protein